MIRYCVGYTENLERVKTFKFINLQWIRRYYDFGEFEMQIPVSDYDSSVKYITVEGRTEVGYIESIELSTTDSNGNTMLVSGYFTERRLDDKIVFPTYNATGTIGILAQNMFNQYRDDINIVNAGGDSDGDRIRMQETGSELGTRIMDLLATNEKSYKVYMVDGGTLNFLHFAVYHGLDRTSNQTENNPVSFSFNLGNVVGIDYRDDVSNYKNYAIVQGEDVSVNRVTVEVDIREAGETYKRIKYVDARDLRSDELTAAEYRETLRQRGLEKLLDFEKIHDVELSIDPLKPGREYLKDFDLGDKVDAIIQVDGVLNESYQNRVTEIWETIKDNTWTVDIVVGNKAPTILEKARR